MLKKGFARINTGYVVALDILFGQQNAAKASKLIGTWGKQKCFSEDIRNESVKLQKDPSSGFYGY